MKTIKSNIKETGFFYDFPHKKEEILFFDIETTGLSPKTSSIYLIGVLYFEPEKGQFLELQWFAERNKDEKIVLTAFLEYLEHYHYVYHFNGKTFDIPYILQKCQKHDIPLSKHAEAILKDTTGAFSIDLLARIRKLKPFLSLQKCSQKALEQFLGIDRKDPYSGGDLISVYARYTQMRLLEPEKADELEQILLLHNHEDVEMMLSICSLLQYETLIRKPELLFSEHTLQNLHAEITNKEETGENFLLLSLPAAVPLPKEICLTLSYPETEKVKNFTAAFTFTKSNILMQFPLFSGTLKFFYPDVKNYYYLPMEDTAIHKSVAGFVDASHREKATKETCYTKREGTFLPNLIPQKKKKQIKNPLFFQSYGDALSFYELPETLRQDTAFFQAFLKEQWQIFSTRK